MAQVGDESYRDYTDGMRQKQTEPHRGNDRHPQTIHRFRSIPYV